MKWFLFWTYVVLPVIVLRSFVGAFLLAASDRPFAALSLCIATLYVAIIYCLHKRQLLGWWLNWASIAAVIPIILIFELPLDAASDEQLVAKYTIRSLIAILFWVAPNVIYWCKRRSLFYSVPRSPQGEQQAAAET